MTHHAPSTSATVPSSNEPPGSRAPKLSGRKTERSPWHIHLSGKIAATCCIQVGRLVKTKNTPEMNWSTSATGVTTAEPLRAVRASDEMAMPQSVQAVTPRTETQANVSHLAVVCGRSRSNIATETASSSTVSAMPMATTMITLPANQTHFGIGVPR